MQYPGLNSTIRGYVHRAPEWRMTAAGAQMCRFTVKIPGGKGQDGSPAPATFVDVTVFPKLAGEFQAANVRDSDLVEIETWSKTEEWSKDGEKKTKLAFYLSRVVEVVPQAPRGSRHDDINF